jgi:DNA polymerase-3 subunit epsilon
MARKVPRAPDIPAAAGLGAAIRNLPASPGVYLFFGGRGELLYVGKSKNIRVRVRSHFSSREERVLCRQVRQIEARQTAGDLGASLLESRLIKELRPLMNVAARERRRIIVARRAENAGGYAVVNLSAVEYLDPAGADPIIAIFKHKTQAAEFFSAIATEYRLCPKLLRLETTRGSCFSYHLKKCDGACLGEEDPGEYNRRFDAAFEQRRVHAWPHDGGAMVVESNEQVGRTEVFYIDNWCLLESATVVAGEGARVFPGIHRFDYDSYRILYGYFANPGNASTIIPTGKEGYVEAIELLKSKSAAM